MKSGVRYRYIALIEAATLRSVPKPAILWRLADAFGTTARDLCPKVPKL